MKTAHEYAWDLAKHLEDCYHRPEYIRKAHYSHDYKDYELTRAGLQVIEQHFQKAIKDKCPKD